MKKFIKYLIVCTLLLTAGLFFAITTWPNLKELQFTYNHWNTDSFPVKLKSLTNFEWDKVCEVHPSYDYPLDKKQYFLNNIGISEVPYLDITSDSHSSKLIFSKDGKFVTIFETFETANWPSKRQELRAKNLCFTSDVDLYESIPEGSLSKLMSKNYSEHLISNNTSN